MERLELLSEPDIVSSTGKQGIEGNVNIGSWKPKYQEGNCRVKGFEPKIFISENEYLQFINDEIRPEVNINPETSRVIHRIIAENGLFAIGDHLGDTGLNVEATVPLGERWEGYSWVMAGTNYPGRVLTQNTLQDMAGLVKKANNLPFKPVRLLPEGFCAEIVKAGQGFSDEDYENLTDVFKASFRTYLTDLSTPEKVKEWADGETTYPVVVRNCEGKIVVVANGDLATLPIPGHEFKFFEIGDSASDPDYRSLGLNRHLKALLISEAKRMGYDSVHAETRAAWGSPNFGNAKNGMAYCGTLPLNCIISGVEDVPETSDPLIEEKFRRFGSLNVWAITPANPGWSNY